MLMVGGAELSLIACIEDFCFFFIEEVSNDKVMGKKVRVGISIIFVVAYLGRHRGKPQSNVGVLRDLKAGGVGEQKAEIWREHEDYSAA